MTKEQYLCDSVEDWDFSWEFLGIGVIIAFNQTDGVHVFLKHNVKYLYEICMKYQVCAI